VSAPRALDSAPALDPRRAERILADLLARLPGYAPEWSPAPDGPLGAVAAIYARQLEALAERVNAAPDKNGLALLDMLGVELLPAAAARAPVAFAVPRAIGDGRAPAGTRLGARAAGPGEPVVFETERSIGLAAARLAEVVSVWPGADAVADHSEAAAGGRPFDLFSVMRPVPHELYLAHDVHLALSGRATVLMEVELTQPASPPALPLEWSWWDGEAWRAFGPMGPEDRDGSFDATDGLTRSGTIRLVAECAASERAIVGGHSAFWIRGRVSGPLPPDPARRLPLVDRIGLRTEMVRTVTAPACAGGLLPEAAFADGQQIDATKPFEPLGPAPGPASTLTLLCEEAFSKPGARVTICLRRAKTAREQADELGADYGADVTAARNALEEARASARKVSDILEELATGPLAPDLPQELFPAGEPEAWYAGVRASVRAARDAIRVALPAELGALGAMLTAIPFGSVAGVPAQILAIVNSADAAVTLSATPPGGDPRVRLVDALSDFSSAATSVPPNLIAAGDALGRAGGALSDIINTVTAGDIFLPAALPTLLTDARELYRKARTRIADALALVTDARAQNQATLDALAKLDSTQAAAAAGSGPPQLPGPEVAWEYWNGRRWSELVAPRPGNLAQNLMASGTIEFDAPVDWAPRELNGSAGRWLRARLAAGGFTRLRLVSWLDTESQIVNFIPVVEPRPPTLDALALGYDYRSAPAPPERCLTHNDFRWQDATEAVRWRGSGVAPFAEVEDATPGVYLGFDSPLPADVVSLFLDIEEGSGAEPGPRLVWEGWSGAAWRPLAVEDETDGFSLPGMVALSWPGFPAPRQAVLAEAGGRVARLTGAAEAARFAAGDLVHLRQGDDAELATVERVAGAELRLTTPLGRAYRGGTVAVASLPRFGTPRTWIRARLAVDADPPRARVLGIHPNAAWAVQAQTLEDETLGSGTGQPGQTLFFTRTPVLGGQVVEVRELEGARAKVDLALLVRDLARHGIAESDLRTVTDPRTGRLREVWVPWAERPGLAFSGPGDRHYVLERTRGRVLFGDGVRGRMPPAGADNVRARRYRSGGGTRGNVPAGAIASVLSGVLAEAARNPRPAEGGADGEDLSLAAERGALVLRHRRQALSSADYEALAREASPAVAVARALAATRPDGRPAAGWVTVLIAPWSPDPEPRPSLELRRHVRRFLDARAPSGMAGRIGVGAARYLPVGVEVVVAPRDPAEAGPVLDAVVARLARFLHPLLGGPQGRGWPFGRDVFLSDVAALVEGTAGVDHARTLVLLSEGTPRGEVVEVPADRIVMAGRLRATLAGGERR
jgi:hypothetical protein